MLSTAFVLLYPFSTASLSCSRGSCVEEHQSFLEAHGLLSLLLFAVPVGIAIATVLSSHRRGLGVLALGVACVAMTAFVIATLPSLGMSYVPSLLCLALALGNRFRTLTLGQGRSGRGYQS